MKSRTVWFLHLFTFVSNISYNRMKNSYVACDILLCGLIKLAYRCQLKWIYLARKVSDHVYSGIYIAQFYDIPGGFRNCS